MSLGLPEVGLPGGSPPPAGRWAAPRAKAQFAARYFLRLLRTHPAYAAGYIIVGAVTVIAAAAPLIAPYSPITADPSVYLQPPGLSHLFGTDATGMDVFSRVIFAPRIDLAIAIMGTMISALIGTSTGAWVGYFQDTRGIRSFLSNVVMRAADVLQAFPVFVFAIALVAVFGQSIGSVVFAIAFVNIPIYLRLMRSQVLSIRRMRYVEAAYIAGMSDLVIIRRHIVPNAIAPVLAQLSVNIGWSVLLTAGLSFVGAGVRAPAPEWGSMIAMGFPNVMTGQWWPSVFPGLALAMTVYGFALIGASIEFMADPRRRRMLASVRLPLADQGG
jgi:peptide/nickel transport system permease protein